MGERDRLSVIQNHLRPAVETGSSFLSMQSTAAADTPTPNTSTVAVVLPERLSDPASWTVRRCRLWGRARAWKFASRLWPELRLLYAGLPRPRTS